MIKPTHAQCLDRPVRRVDQVLPPQRVHYVNFLLKDRVPFGADFPLIGPDCRLGHLEQAGIKNSAKPLIFKHDTFRPLRQDQTK